MPLLARRRRVIAVDTLGLGNSDDPPAGFRIEDHARNIVSLCDALSISKADILGTATGARIAAEIAAQWPQRVRRLVLLGMPYFDSEKERADCIAARINKQDAWKPGIYALEKAESGASPAAPQAIADYNADVVRAGRRLHEYAVVSHSYREAVRLPLIQASTLVIGFAGSTLQGFHNRPHELCARIPQGRVELLNVDSADQVLSADSCRAGRDASEERISNPRDAAALLVITYGNRAEALAQIVLNFLDG
jgi:pimeloyl-ACP methyl ester carboxylesterase